MTDSAPLIHCCTGHRPGKLSGGYADSTFERLVSFAHLHLQSPRPTLMLTGMALGWDMAVAVACIELSIPFAAYIPFIGQESLWPRNTQDHYQSLLSLAQEVHIVSPGGFAGWKMQRRNEQMVDIAQSVLTLWNGERSGGTFNCVEYARVNGVPVNNVWKEWLEYTH